MLKPEDLLGEEGGFSIAKYEERARRHTERLTAAESLRTYASEPEVRDNLSKISAFIGAAHAERNKENPLVLGISKIHALKPFVLVKTVSGQYELQTLDMMAVERLGGAFEKDREEALYPFVTKSRELVDTGGVSRFLCKAAITEPFAEAILKHIKQIHIEFFDLQQDPAKAFAIPHALMAASSKGVGVA